MCARTLRTSVTLHGRVNETKKSTIARTAARERTPRYLLVVIAAIAIVVFVTERFVLTDRQSDTQISSPARAPSLAHDIGPAPAPAAPVDTSSPNGAREVLLDTSSHQGGNAPPTQTPAAPLPASGVADSVRGASTDANDELQGIHVFPGRNRGAFAQLGLHPGDLVTAIDGVPVSGQASTDIFSQLQSGTDSTVTVFRAGRLQQITVHAPNAADP